MGKLTLGEQIQKLKQAAKFVDLNKLSALDPTVLKALFDIIITIREMEVPELIGELQE
ncbi:MAG: hypothetical protein ACE5D7_00835 [Fidelibacterota bacterium]